MDRNTGADAAQNAERRAFYERIDRLGMTPLWEVLGALVPPAPKSPVAAVHFRYDEIRPHVLEAGRSAGLLVRDFSAYPRLDRCLRISIGTPEQNERLLAAVAQA